MAGIENYLSTLIFKFPADFHNMQSVDVVSRAWYETERFKISVFLNPYIQYISITQYISILHSIYSLSTFRGKDCLPLHIMNSIIRGFFSLTLLTENQCNWEVFVSFKTLSNNKTWVDFLVHTSTAGNRKWKRPKYCVLFGSTRYFVGKLPRPLLPQFLRLWYCTWSLTP